MIVRAGLASQGHSRWRTKTVLGILARPIQTLQIIDLTLEYGPECMLLVWGAPEAQSKSAKRRSEPDLA